MTKAEYAEYEAAVARFFESEELRWGFWNEGGGWAQYSSRPCECCLRKQEGNRIKVGATPKRSGPEPREPVYWICVDCEYYVEYGKLDDQTMIEMEDEGDERNETI